MMKDVKHRSILEERLGAKFGDPSFQGRPGELVEQQRTDPVMLKLIRDHERHLGLSLSWRTVVPTDSD